MAATSLDPTSTRLTLTSADHRVHLNVVIGQDGTGYLASNGTLAALPANQTYQLWGSGDTGKVSPGVIGRHPDVVAFPASTGSYAAMAITTERAGGAAQPTTAPVASGLMPPAPNPQS